MLRIHSENRQGRSFVLRLEGALRGPWVEELRAACEDALCGSGRVAIDASEVAFVDSAGAALLAQFEKHPRVEIDRASALVMEVLRGEAS